MSKKQEILDAALTLFSEKGFDAVGVDEIGEYVGVKGPALYHYFKGKEAILDELLNTIEDYYGARFNAGSLPKDVDEFIDMSFKRLQFTIHDPVIKKVRKLITIEQFRNGTFNKLATKHFILDTAKVNRDIIQHLIREGKIKDLDPGVLAFEFTAPVTVLISLIDRQPEVEEKVMENIKNHLQHFKNTYSKGGK
ncbi:MAG: TetR/AcrR family transcriptional regulator [Clostridia bacterium]|nr:TetR/AcrR family transcriptional regulator [Clostridia bacterium]